MCKDCTLEQVPLLSIGIIPKDLGTMCRECISCNSKKCSKHGVTAKSLCFSLECNALVCEDCYEEQNYNNHISDVVYCEECIAKYNDGNDMNLTFYQNSLKYFEKTTTHASSTGSISGSGSASINVHLVNSNVITNKSDYGLCPDTKTNYEEVLNSCNLSEATKDNSLGQNHVMKNNIEV